MVNGQAKDRDLQNRFAYTEAPCHRHVNLNEAKGCGILEDNRVRIFVLLHLTYVYSVIHKSVKHFKNSQQIDYSTDHGTSYADRERNSPRFFFFF